MTRIRTMDEMMWDVPACTTKEAARKLVDQEVSAVMSENGRMAEDTARRIVVDTIGYLTGAGMTRAESGRILELFETEHPYFGRIENFPQSVGEGLALGLMVGEASKTMPTEQALALGRLRARQIRGEGKTSLSEQPQHLFVDGIVAARNKVPYVTISTEQGRVAQLDLADARQVAADILRAAGNAEADAMILKFFEKMEYPEGAGAAIMIQFRDFRHELDSAEDQARAVKPDEG